MGRGARVRVGEAFAQHKARKFTKKVQGHGTIYSRGISVSERGFHFSLYAFSG